MTVLAFAGGSPVTVVFAHAGHVLVDLAIYLGPVLVIGVALYVADRREKRRSGRDRDGAGPSAA